MSNMKIPDIIIAVDGYSATGKSSFAKSVAAKFGLTYLDSGAMYRAVTLFAIENKLIAGGRQVNVESLVAALPSCPKIHFGEANRTFLGERCVEKEIRSMKVSSKVSLIAAVPEVRAFVDEKLHEAGRAGGVIMDGRDIGTAVFPDAQLKIFVTASDKVRAQRRFDELVLKGQPESMEEVVRNLAERDYIDSHRETNPLRQAPDAFVLDNSEMSLEEELVWVRGLIQGRFGILQ